MDRIFNLSQLHKNASSEDLKQGSFGIEWEGLRVRENGELSLSPHSEIFGNKLSNPYITTDFSESQIEIITPTFDTIDEAFSFFSFMSDLVNSSLDDDEFLWFQSLPCILPDSSEIPIAKYKGRELAEESMEYRKGLAKKYGLRKQLISGIHFNFSFKEELIEKGYLGTDGTVVGADGGAYPFTLTPLNTQITTSTLTVDDTTKQVTADVEVNVK